MAKIIRDTKQIINQAQNDLSNSKRSVASVFSEVIVTWMKSSKIAFDIKARHGNIPKSYTRAFDYFMIHYSNSLSRGKASNLLKKTRHILVA